MALVSSSTADIPRDCLFPRFCQCFLDVSNRGLTGTLKVSVAGNNDDSEPEGRDVLLLFHNGGIVDVDLGSEDSLLVEGILSTGVFSDRERKKYRKRGQKRNVSFGAELFETGRVEDGELLEIIQELLIQSSCDVFAEDLAAFEFIEHTEDELVEGFDNELSEIFDLMFAGTDIFVEAMRKLGRWGEVERYYGGLFDIYYAAPSGMKYYNEPDQYECEVTIIKRMDGALDVGEVIKSTPLDPFVALQTVQTLAYQADIQRLNPIQMFQLGVEAIERRFYQKARRIFQRAMDLGLDDFDIQFKLAQTYEALKDLDGATKRYFKFAEKCLSQSRRGDAARAYQHITQLDPLNADLQKKTIELLIADNRHEEALVQGLTAAESLGGAGSPRSALDLLLFLRNYKFQEKQLSRKIIQFAERCGERRLVEEELANNTTRLDEILDIDQALEMYQRQFCEGNDTLDIRLKLIELHLQKGNKSETLEHINGVLGSKLEKMINERKILVWLHKTRSSLNPGNLTSGRWLVNHYAEGDKIDKARDTLNVLIKHAEKENEPYCLVELHRSFLKLDPDCVESRWELTRLYHAQEKYSLAVGQLQKIAEVAMAKNDLVTLKKAWSEAVRIAPFRRDALIGLGDALAESGQRKQASRYFRAVLQTDLAGGNLTGAREALNKIEAIEPNSPAVAQRFGIALIEAGDRGEGVEYLLKAAETFLDRKDFGSAGETVDLALEAMPDSKQAERLKGKIQLRQKPPAPVPVEQPAAAASPAPQQTAAVAERVMMSAGPDDPLGEKEAFQPRAPIKKAPVSAITARLRNLKTSKPAGRGGTFSGKQIVKTGLKSITDNLKRQRQAEPAAPSTTPTAEATAATPSTATAASPTGPTAEAAPERPSPPAVAAVTKKKGVGGAASRLKALAGGGDQAAAPVAPSPAPTADADAVPPPPDAATETSPAASTGGGSSGGLGAALVNDQLDKIKSGTGAVTKKASMGGAASRLAKLRAMKSAAASPPEPLPEGSSDDVSENETEQVVAAE